ncbi:MAG TPA: GNAT family N-acetyltransferase [Pyrinomonadaceae bacterium]
MDDDFTVRPLTDADAPALASMLKSQSPEYVRFFTPFTFDEAAVAAILAGSGQDVYMGLYWRARLAGFFMLRGWDAGYEVPAYGVLVDEAHSGYGLTTLTLGLAKAICRLRAAPRLMLKVHPDNARAKRLFERAGFKQTGVEPGSGGLVYHLDFNGPSGKV